MFSSEQIEALLRGESIEDGLPFVPHDEASTRAFYEPIVRSAGERLGLGIKAGWDDHGSGYASYIEAWFYRLDQAGRLSSYADHHDGIWVLLSGATRYFVIGQGDKTWSTKGGGSDFPSFEAVDEITNPVLVPLVEPLVEHLTAAGLVRLHREDLAGTMETTTRVATILSNPPYREFDALFQWED